MMNDISKQLTSFYSLIPFVQSLRSMPPIEWNRPLQPGKWSTCGVIGHIMLWDKHFMEDAIQPIAEDTLLKLKHSNFNAFNAQAALYAATVDQDQLIDACIAQRQQLYDIINSLTPEQFEKEHSDGEGNPFTIPVYLEDFIEHDLHHKLQIEQFLHS